VLEQGPNVSGLLEPDWVECRSLGASGSMTPWWPPSRGMGIGSRGFVMCLDLLTSVLMKMREGVWGGGVVHQPVPGKQGLLGRRRLDQPLQGHGQAGGQRAGTARMAATSAEPCFFRGRIRPVARGDFVKTWCRRP